MRKRVFMFIIAVLMTFPAVTALWGQTSNNIKGLGVIEVDAEYTTYRNVTRTRERYVGGTGGGSFGSKGVYSTSPGTERHVETEYYTTTEAVKDDYRLPFIILENGIEVFRGNTPIRVTNFDPGVTYTIIWNGANGARKEGTFVITTARPFTRYIHLE
jgi:hypothetical protein